MLLRMQAPAACYTAAADAKAPALSAEEWRDFKLAHRQQLTHNTALFRWAAAFHAPQHAP
jgi:hypothetical protein